MGWHNHRNLAACTRHVIGFSRDGILAVTIDPKKGTIDWTLVGHPSRCRCADEFRVAGGQKYVRRSKHHPGDKDCRAAPSRVRSLARSPVRENFRTDPFQSASCECRACRTAPAVEKTNILQRLSRRRAGSSNRPTLGLYCGNGRLYWAAIAADVWPHSGMNQLLLCKNRDDPDRDRTDHSRDLEVL